MYGKGCVLLLVACLLAFFCSWCNATSLTETLDVHTSFVKTANTNAAYYDFGKLVAFEALNGDRTCSLLPFTACMGMHTVYLLFGFNTISRGSTHFMVGLHDADTVVEAMEKATDGMVFAPTFKPESVSVAPLNRTQWLFTTPTARTEAAAMLWWLYRNMPLAQTIAVVAMDTDNATTMMVNELAHELEARDYAVTVYATLGDVGPVNVPFHVTLLLSSFEGPDSASAIDAVVKAISANFTAAVITNSGALSPLLIDACTRVVGGPPVTSVSNVPFAEDISDPRFHAVREAYDQAYAAVSAAVSGIGSTSVGYPQTPQTPAQHRLAMAGFLDMSAFLNVVLRLGPLAHVSTTDFAKQLGQLFTFGYPNEWLVGPFTGRCSGDGGDAGDAEKAHLARLGLPCEVYNGGRRLIYVGLEVSVDGVRMANRPQADDFTLPVNSGDLTLSSGKYTPGRYVLARARLPSSDAAGLGVDTLALVVKDYFPRLAAPATTAGTLFIGRLPTTTAEASSETIRTNNKVLFVDPIDRAMTLRHNRTNVLYFSSTVEQELHVLANYFRQQQCATGECPPITLHPSQSTKRDSVVAELFASYGITVTPSPAAGQWSATTHPHVLVLGDVAGLRTAMDDASQASDPWPEVTLWMPYDVLALEFSTIKSHHEANAAPKSIYFASSLPPWDTTVTPTVQGVDADTQPSFKQAYLSAVPEAGRDPITLKTFFSLTMLQEISQRGVSTFVAAANISRAAYPSTGVPNVLRTRSARLGPYAISLCSGQSCTNGSRLIKNYGAQAVHVWSLEQSSLVPQFQSSQLHRYVEDHYARLTSPPRRARERIALRCGKINVDGGDGGHSDQSREKRNGISTAAVVGIVVVCACLAAILVAVLLVYYCCFYIGNTRDNNNAPKDPSQPVTLLFTDIQSSTTLWALAPREMADALAAHHDIIRRLIVKYKGYEVKTVGDSFMIACTDAFAGVQLARDIQFALFEHNWGTAQFDTLYQSSDKKGGVEDAEKSTNPTATGSCWNGLRVRIGIHTGLANIEHDMVSKGYDYYGDTPNTAARTEQLTHGGQVVLTHFTVEQLTPAQREALTLESIGPQYLRGVSGAIEMFQLVTVPGRAFPVIVTGAPAQDGKESPDKMAHQATDSGQAAPEEDPSHAVPDPEHVQSTRGVLDAFFGPYEVRKRIKLLQKISKRVGLAVPRRADTAEDAYLEDLMDALCVHTTKVLDIRRAIEAAMNEVDVDSEMGSVAFSQRTAPREGSIVVASEPEEKQSPSLAYRQAGAHAVPRGSGEGDEDQSHTEASLPSPRISHGNHAVRPGKK